MDRPSHVDDYDFRLTFQERAGGLWPRLRDHLQFLLEEKRIRLEKPQMPDTTDRLRGEITCLRSILAFGTDPPPILDDGGEAGTRSPRDRHDRRAT
jgi:hypothetical protein